MNFSFIAEIEIDPHVQEEPIAVDKIQINI